MVEYKIFLVLGALVWMGMEISGLDLSRMARTGVMGAGGRGAATGVGFLSFRGGGGGVVIDDLRVKKFGKRAIFGKIGL